MNNVIESYSNENGRIYMVMPWIYLGRFQMSLWI